MNGTDLEAEIRRLHGESFGWAIACCRGDRPDAEDVLQNTYLKVLSGRAQFHGRSGFRTWLFGVIRHTANEQRRSGTRYDLAVQRSTSEVMTHVATDAAALERMEHDEVTHRLLEALGRLTEMQRSVLHLVFYQSMTIEDAAAVLGVRTGTARTHYERGKKRLRVLLSGMAAR
jgi:RNA polymerase sigma-70 factor (ECF subfamily)